MDNKLPGPDRVKELRADLVGYRDLGRQDYDDLIRILDALPGLAEALRLTLDRLDALNAVVSRVDYYANYGPINMARTALAKLEVK